MADQPKDPRCLVKMMVPSKDKSYLGQHVNSPAVLREEGCPWQLNNGSSGGCGSHAQVRSLYKVVL